ncbi:hypothetical protein COCNU_scaffold003237G000010 [Cocos nucifera]|nr:hypothetical protein [Cocos nucifera]
MDGHSIFAMLNMVKDIGASSIHIFMIMTSEELEHLSMGITTLNRKDGSIGESLKRTHVEEMSSIVPTQAAPDSKIAVATPSLTLPDETTIPALPEQGEVVEKKKKKTIAKKIRRKVEGSGDLEN